MAEKPKKQPGALKSFLAGGAGGVCLVVVGKPFILHSNEVDAGFCGPFAPSLVR